MILAVLVIVGIGAAVFADSQNLTGLVLGAKSRKENIYQNKTDGLKVTIISPDSSWDLMQYLCKTRDGCSESPTSGKWWATVSGAATTEDGHEVFIEKSEGWADYEFLKVVVRKAGLGSGYLNSSAGGQYHLYNLSTAFGAVETLPSIIFQ